MSVNPEHFCYCVTTTDTVGKTRAALLDATRWTPGSVIRVRFLEGDPKLQERVKKVAQGWTGPSMANLTLSFVDQGDADIRVAFQQGNGSWSYLGTMCRQIPKAQPTMNYGWLTPASSDEQVQSVVLHEFGHALGLIHEHQNPNKAIKWNRDAVIRDLSGPPNNWDLATIERNIFQRYDPAQMTTTPVDKDSIMMYPIPKAWTLDGFETGFTKSLSSTDKQFILKAYAW